MNITQHKLYFRENRIILCVIFLINYYFWKILGVWAIWAILHRFGHVLVEKNQLCYFGILMQCIRKKYIPNMYVWFINYEYDWKHFLGLRIKVSDESSPSVSLNGFKVHYQDIDNNKIYLGTINTPKYYDVWVEHAFKLPVQVFKERPITILPQINFGAPGRKSVTVTLQFLGYNKIR